MYTVGVKRRWWFGYKEYHVTEHGTVDGRLRLNLTDGSQISLPGVQTLAFKVYPDFWIHLNALRPAPVPAPPAPAPIPRQVEALERVETRSLERVETRPEQTEYVRPEVKNAASERVRRILSESGIPADLS